MAISKVFKTFITNHPKVGDWYHDGMYYDVRMKGWCDDYDTGRHIIIDTNAADVMKRIKRATPCNCVECIQQSK